MLKRGITLEKEIIADENTSAVYMKSGTLNVFSTPSMVALMEDTSKDLVFPHLDEGYTTVGTSLDIKHVASTPIGMKIRCVATLIEIDNRTLTFDVKVYDEVGLIGEGRHQRFIVNGDRFLAKTYAKNENRN